MRTRAPDRQRLARAARQSPPSFSSRYMSARMLRLPLLATDRWRGFTRPPPLTSEKLAELELHGVDAMRGMLASATDGYSGTSRMVVTNLGAIAVTRGEIQDWLKWKAARDGCWI